MIRVLALLLLFNFSCSSQPTTTQHEKALAPFRVVGFYHGKGSDIEKYEIDKLTHLIFCFTYLQGNKINIKNREDEETLKRFVSLKAKYPKLKVLVSFGGWGGCETCSDVFASDSGRKEFAISVKDLLIKHKADGIDLDWDVGLRRYYCHGECISGQKGKPVY